MKKVLFAAGLVALATSCSQDELTSLTMQENKEGITFVSEGAPESRVQWDYISADNEYSPFWYAEQDRVSIYSAGVNKGYNAGSWTTTFPGNQAAVTWATLSNAATYKATQSAQSGKFTAVSDLDMLGFAGDIEAKFFAVYPSSITVAAAADKITLSDLPKIAEQTQKGLNGQNEALFMYANATAKKAYDYNSVGETVSLKYKFPISALGLRTANANKYTVSPTGGTSVFGNLENITIVAKGYDKDGDGNYEEGDILPSEIAYDETLATMQVSTSDFDVATLIPGTPDPSFDPTKIVLNINQEWNDGALAMAAIRDVKRSDKFSAAKPETFEITYNFENISLSTTVEEHKTVTIDFDGFITYPALDMNTFKYLVTNESTLGANDRTLIVNAGTFAEIFNNAGKVIWNNTPLDLDDFQKIYVNNITLTPAECQKIAGFSNLVEIELNENTSIPANTFSATQAGKLTSIVMPKVTTIDTKFVANAEGQSFTKLINLNLAAYEFASDKVNKTFFNASTKTTLKTLDMSGVKNMLPTFGIDRSLSFEGYALTSVTVQNGMKVAPKGFKDCKSLTTVTGVIDLLNGDESFSGADKLTKININGTEIPYMAFNEATLLSEVLYNGVQVKPTKVGFKGFFTTGITYMDLANLEEVGESAFNLSNLTAPVAGEQIMKIGAKHISTSAFANTNLKMINFTQATSIDNKILKGTDLVHLKFTKAFTVDEETVFDAETFGSVTNIDLFINPSQKYMSGTTMTLNDIEFKFKTVQKEN